MKPDTGAVIPCAGDITAIVLAARHPNSGKAKTRRSKDGTWTKKGGRSHFRYKLHAIVDNDYDLIRRIPTTTAPVHDSRIDLSEE